jgi:hypothetical protein
MTGPEVIVDLGDVSAPPPIDTGAEALRERLAGLRALIPLMLTLLLVTGAASAPLSAWRPAADVPIGDDARVLIDHGSLFTLSAAARSDGRATLTGYRLGDGRRWSATVAEPASASLIQAVDGTVLVSTDRPDPTGLGTRTESFDAVTGRRLWATDLGAAIVIGSEVLARTASSGYALLDPHTGAARWTIEAPTGCVTSVTADTAVRLVEVCSSDATMRLYDLADGRRIASRKVDLGLDTGRDVVAPADYMANARLVIIRDTIMVMHAGAPTPVVDAYGLSDLRQLWHGMSITQDEDIQACGSSLCMYETNTSGIEIDPATGALIGPATAALSPIRAIHASYALVTPTSSTAIPIVTLGADTPIASVAAVPGPVWLVRVDGAPVGPLPDTGMGGCVEAGAYIACDTSAGRLVVWPTTPPRAP